MTTDIAPHVLAFGDSLTAGYGLPHGASFAARLEVALRECRPGACVQNAGVSGDTTQDGLARLPRLLSQLSRKPDLAIVELGANDLLCGVPPERVRANLGAILDLFDRCGIRVLLATMEVPRFLGPFADRYVGLYAALAARHGVATAPFFPPGVLGHRELVLPDGLHPNARGTQMIATAFLPAVLNALDAERAWAA